MLKPSISHVLLAEHNSLRELLAAAKSIEKQKKKISNNFPQDSKPLQKPFKPWNNQAVESSIDALSTKTASAKGSLAASARKGRERRLIATQGTSANEQFMPTSTKPQRWIGS